MHDSHNDEVQALRTQLQDAKEAVGFFSIFFAVVGFMVGALAQSAYLQGVMDWVMP